jgi:hypothetical protein
MNTKTAITELSTRFDAFEERLAKLGIDVSTITALFYNYINDPQPQFYVNTFGWKPIYVSGWRPSDMEELALANVMAWSEILGKNSEEGVGGSGHNVGKETKSPQ